jgi:alkanesulfonate monooxygenase SsuD/methylene tetrahydromethanopterin reductase-like flavin-dependent oxidoreductase (luciferase family)
MGESYKKRLATLKFPQRPCFLTTLPGISRKEEIMKYPIKFGLRIPAFPLHDSRGLAFRDEIVEYLAALEGRFDSAWLADHFIPWHTETDPTTDTLECWTGLSYLAGKFEGYNFGTIVLSQSYRNPALLGKMAATFQFMSSGRLILAIGAGWKEDEYLAYGYDYPSTATRIHQMGEAVQIIQEMWRQPKATFHGKYYHVDDAICEPKFDPMPPIMIGGGGKKITLRYVAQLADWWNFPGGTPEHYAGLLEVLQGHCRDVGRDYDEIVKTWAIDCVAVAETHADAVETARISPLYDPETSLIGTPDEVEAQLRRFTDMGVTHFMFRFADFPKTKSAQFFASEVAPRFNR